MIFGRLRTRTVRNVVHTAAMGDRPQQFLAISSMMRYADIDATRDLDRGTPEELVLRGWPAAGTAIAATPIDSLPAA